MKPGPILTATAVVAALFALALIAIPETFVAIFGVKYDVYGTLTARVLAGAWFGYAYLNWAARDASPEAQRTTVITDAIQDVVGLVVAGYAAISGVGNALMWVWVAIFVVFGVAYVYLLTMKEAAAAPSRT